MTKKNNKKQLPDKKKPSTSGIKKTNAKKAKPEGGKAPASRGAGKKKESKGTSAVISRSNPLFFFPFCLLSDKCALANHHLSHSSYVFSALLTSDTVWR